MDKLFFLIPVFFFFTSCNKPGVDAPQEGVYIKLDSIQGRYLLPNEEPYRGFATGGTAYFTYDVAGRIIKREGGFITVPVSSGYSYIYVKEVFDTINYIVNDKVSIELKTNLAGLLFNGGKREVDFSNNLLSKKITYNRNSNEFDNDTTFYFFDAAKRMQKTEKYSFSNYTIQDFVFDTNGNLISVTSTTRDRSNSNVIYTVVENFLDYDNSTNPLKPLVIWDDILFRSLSTNNFRRYTYTKRNSLNQIVEFRQINWSLVYDGNGNVDYSR